MATLALIGLGSNLGDRKAHLDAAVSALRAIPGLVVRAVSSSHESAPAGGPSGQGAFLNAAAALETTLEPRELLRCLHDIEARAGRERTARWGPRTLDLDLLLYGDLVLESGRTSVFGGPQPAPIPLRIPHPRLAVRRFVLAPLSEIAPDVVDPLTGRTIRGLLANLDRRPNYVALSGLPGGLEGSISGDVVEAAMATRMPRRRVARVFPDLVNHLNAVGVSLMGDAEPHQDLSKLLVAPPDVPFAERLGASLERQVQSLDAAHWRAEADRLSDRWLVSDFWLDELWDLAARLQPDARWARFRDRFLEARARVLTPKFAVVPDDRPGHFRFGRFPSTVRWAAPLGETPVLEVSARDRSGIQAEVLAACAASLGG